MAEITEHLSTALADRYRIERRLGEGGMAVVHEAIDLVHGRRVALKRLRSDNVQKRAAFTALFEQEFLALSELAHPRIVGLIEVVAEYRATERREEDVRDG